jgi:histone chaperone ASF1
MSVVALLGVNIINNPAKFTDNYVLEITFECLEQLEKGMLQKASQAHHFHCAEQGEDQC